MLVSSFFSPVVAASLAASAVAAPAPSPFWGNLKKWISPTQRTPITDYNAPLSNDGGSISLPGFQPMQVQAVTVGRGTQNYSCSTSGPDEIPVATGAVATLYDTSRILSLLDLELGEEILNALPSIMLGIPRDRLEHSGAPVAGHHYFNAAGAPTFDLRTSSCGFLVGSKVGEIPASKEANPGHFGAVAWLALNAKDGSHDLKKAYRTVTAGGKPPTTCHGQPKTITIEYAAQYFFY